MQYKPEMPPFSHNCEAFNRGSITRNGPRCEHCMIDDLSKKLKKRCSFQLGNIHNVLIQYGRLLDFCIYFYTRAVVCFEKLALLKPTFKVLSDLEIVF